MGKRKDFGWRYQPSAESGVGILLDYLDVRDYHPSEAKTEMMLKALSAFYQPLAHLAKGCSREEVESLGWESVFSLLRQVDYLCSTLGLERASAGGLMPNGINSKETFPRRNYPKKPVAAKEMTYDFNSLEAFSVTYIEK